MIRQAEAEAIGFAVVRLVESLPPAERESVGSMLAERGCIATPPEASTPPAAPAPEPEAAAPKNSDSPDDLLTEKEAAKLVKYSPRTLAKWRSDGEGPPFHKIGRAIRYRRGDVLKWVTGKRRRSTSDDGEA